MLSSDAATLRSGDAVRLEQWGGERVLTGRVRFVEPAAFTRVSALGVDEQRVNVIIDVPSAPTALGDGYRVETRIITWSRPDVVTVPVSALVRVGSSWSTYVVSDGRAQRREVHIGHVGDALAELLTGLTVSDEVVLFPSDKIVDGVRVAVRRLSAATEVRREYSHADERLLLHLASYSADGYVSGTSAPSQSALRSSGSTARVTS